MSAVGRPLYGVPTDLRQHGRGFKAPPGCAPEIGAYLIAVRKHPDLHVIGSPSSSTKIALTEKKLRRVYFLLKSSCQG
jgi:hypothetical protein